MAGIRTHRTDESVEDFVGAVSGERRREDIRSLVALMSRVTGEAPAVWSNGAIGFGTFHYRSKSGQEGDWFPVGLASRKAAITIYLGVSLDGFEQLLSDLGPHTVGMGCIYIKRLADIDPAVLEELVRAAESRVRTMYP